VTSGNPLCRSYPWLANRVGVWRENRPLRFQGCGTRADRAGTGERATGDFIQQLPSLDPDRFRPESGDVPLLPPQGWTCA